MSATAEVNMNHHAADQQAGSERAGSPAKLYELAPEKMEIRLRINSAAGRHELTHHLRPPKLADWSEYERNLKSTVEASGHAPEALQFDSAAMEASVALYDSLFLEARGYCATGQQNGVCCKQIPVHHKEMVIRALGDVGAETPQETAAEGASDVAPFALDPERITIALQAHTRGESYAGLLHTFTPPTAADRISYSRIVSQALYVRGSQSLKTLLPARLPGLVRMYDQLISEVRGYCVQGSEVSDRPSIIRHMDPLHKKAAVQELFEV